MHQPDILLIEDENFLIKPLQFAFEKRGAMVRIAKDGDQGIFMARRHAPDLILLDLLLPKMSGFEVLKEMKRDPSTACIPVLILSNLAREEHVARSLAAGAEGYIVKSNASIDSIVKCALAMIHK